MPQRLWLGIGAKAVSLYKPGEPEPLDSFCYGRISSFGASDSSTFRLSVEDRDLLFETSQVRAAVPLSPVSPGVVCHPGLTQRVPSAPQVDEIAQLLNTYLTSAGAQRPPRPQEPVATSPPAPPGPPQGLCPTPVSRPHRPPVGSFHS